MRVTTNIHRSASSILELFKFVTSLALVSAVSVWIGILGTTTPALAIVLDHTLLLTSFVLVLVRYYHGNSLHLLERYADGATAPKLDVALPTDGFFILLQGIVLVALSFSVKEPMFFGAFLTGLLIIDAVWSGSLVQLNQEPTGGYIRRWFLINLIGSIALVLMWLSTLNASPRLIVILLFAFVLLHTLADYWLNWRRYFPTTEERDMMLGAPLTAKLIDGRWQDLEMKDCITRAYFICQQNGYRVYSAHLIEEFGAKLRKLSGYVLEDVRQAKDAAVYVGITDGTQSNGMAVELGIAASCGTEIILFVKASSPHVSFLEELTRMHGGTVLPYSSSDDLIEKLCRKLKLTKGSDPGLFFGETRFTQQ
jgi:hypothetical protein